VQILARSDVRIIKEDEAFFVEAPEITQAADATEARHHADTITRDLSGLLRLEFDLTTPLSAGSVIEIEDDGTRRIYGFDMAQVADAVVALGTPAITGDVQAPQVDRGIDVASRQRHERQVALVARLLAEGPSWSSIYKILDAVGDDVGGLNRLKRKAWIPATEFQRITLTANAHETALDGGRHATRDISLSNSKLSAIPLDEAWSGVTRLVDAWLRWRA
jgi:hypothetical protein